MFKRKGGLFVLYSYKPEPNYNGSTAFTFSAIDNSTAPGAPSASAAATVSISVSAVNDAPIVVVAPHPNL
jgi:hypothetical protein